MLTFSQLQQYYQAQSIKGSAKNILIEYLQYEILDSIYKQKESVHLSFIGGTAIRLVYNSGRFSEDLDFDNFGLSFEAFKKLLNKVVKDMELKGFNIEFRFVEKGAFHCYVKFPDILHQEGLSDNFDEKILVRIDTVNKDKKWQPTIHTLNKFDIYRDILVNAVDVIMSQKLIAALERKREKGRDFYDISYLYGLTEPNFNYLEKHLGVDKKSFINKFLAKCDKLDFKSLAKDVEPFLFNPEQVNRVVEFNNFIKQKLK